MAGAADLPLTDAGMTQIREIAEGLKGASLSTVLCGPDEASRAVAKAVSEATGARVRGIEGLAEADLGLWEGLRRAELEERYPTAFRQWLEDPCSVTAPEGEATREAGDRIVSALGRALERHKSNGHGIAVVLRPVAYSLVRCWLEGRDASDLWSILAYTPEHRWQTIPREAVKAAREGMKAAL